MVIGGSPCQSFSVAGDGSGFDGVSVCGVLLRKHNKSKFNAYVVSGVFTIKNMRLKGYAKGLIAVAKMLVREEHKAKLCLDNNLTDLGKCLFKRGV